MSEGYNATSSHSRPHPLRPHRPGPAELLVLAACVALLGAFTQIDVASGFSPPPDFSEMPVDRKKRRFFAYLSPMIAQVNFEMAADRDRIHELREAYMRGERIGWFNRRWLDRVASRLEVPIDDMELGEALELLERRAGVVPESIVLVQAALESGWGTSRFATEGNNYFGQRCYSPGCGMSPDGRPNGTRFGLAEFASVAASVESYIMNLNTHPSYTQFRKLREQRRKEGKPITGLALVEGLANYSERGSEYVAEIASMIRNNDLE